MKETTRLCVCVCVSLSFPPYHRAYLRTAKNWGRGVTEWKEETEECGGERERRKGWKVKLWSEKGRQLVTYVCVCECVCGSLTVMSRKEP